MKILIAGVLLLAVGRGRWGPGALLAGGIALVLAGVLSFAVILQHGKEPSWIVPEGSRGVKLGLSILFVAVGVAMAVAGIVLFNTES